MIYTIGFREAYDDYFKEQEHPKKLGKMPGYPGGSVWKTREEAQAACPEGFSVYGVEADWNRDTVSSGEEKFHDLLYTSLLVKLED